MEKTVTPRRFPKALVDAHKLHGAVRLTPELKTEYQDLYDRCTVLKNHEADVDRFVAKMESNKDRYQSVSGKIPTALRWWFIAVVHGLECDFNFKQHLHNGDSLNSRTHNVPAGRPKEGQPPFQWEASALDALRCDGMFEWSDWTIPGLCYALERYNGFGYRLNHPRVLSPYLWSYSSNYSKGKYSADGHFDNSLVSKECGAITAIKRAVELGKIKLG